MPVALLSRRLLQGIIMIAVNVFGVAGLRSYVRFPNFDSYVVVIVKVAFIRIALTVEIRQNNVVRDGQGGSAGLRPAHCLAFTKNFEMGWGRMEMQTARMKGMNQAQNYRLNSALNAKYDKDIDPLKMTAHEKRKVKELIMDGEHKKLIEQLLSKVPVDKVLTPVKRTRLVPSKEVSSAHATDNASDALDVEEHIYGSAEERDLEEPTHVNKIRTSYFVLHKGDVHVVLASQHVSQARSRGHYKIKMRNLVNNKEISQSFSDGTKLSVVTPNKLQALKFLKPELEVTLSRWRGQVIGLFVPHQIQYKVKYVNPGNFAATLENGMVVLVPSYVKQGDSIDVNTAKGEFLRRSSIG
ncbi:elongation factor P [Babesia caballi]|uniref:Elongation factor P n=1 Tax=Babesia caballi TaxID=5871 RepID=A0AAV4LXA2_BABCB|nr:elongation factor P [Babesia caballi]